jgi:putative PIN family toxin of toxin-antitoxin system
VALFLDDVGEMVAPEVQVDDLRDVADNRVLECALAGRADLIVTGDRAMLELSAWRGIRVVTVAAFLDE